MQALSILVILILVYLFLVSPRVRVRKFKTPGLLAHRGLHDAGAGIPENSLAAFEAAAGRGYGIELDVQLTADGQLVVFHDQTLERMCNLPGEIGRMTLAQLRECTLLDTAERIPTLDEALNLIDGRVPLLIELKNCASCGDLVRLTMRCLDDYKGLFLIESFSPLALRALRRAYPTVIRGQLVAKYDARHRYIPIPLMFTLSQLLGNFLSRPDFIAYDQRMDGGFAMSVQRRLFRVPLAVWTVRSEAEYERLRGRVEMVIFEGFLP